MRLELKKEIINWIFEHTDEFQIVNACVDQFRAYIYDSTGNYLIGGKEVYVFIKKTIELVKEEL